MNSLETVIHYRIMLNRLNEIAALENRSSTWSTRGQNIMRFEKNALGKLSPQRTHAL
jgi:hypothetical protein